MNDRRKIKPAKKNKAPLWIGLLLLLTVLGAGGYYIGKKLLPNFQYIPFYTYYESIDQDTIYIVLGEERPVTENNPVVKDGTLYIPVDFIKNYEIDEYIFWDQKANRLTITTENKVMRMKTEELSYYINDRPTTLNLPLYKMDGMAYLPDSLVEELYNVQIRYEPTYKTVIIDYKDVGRTLGQVTASKTNLRYDPDKKSPIEEKLVQGESLTLYGEYDNYTKVRTETGLLGYVPTKDIKKTNTLGPVTREDAAISAPPKKHLEINGKINLLWDQVTTVEASADPGLRQPYQGLNVISPTWFSFDLEKMDGSILNIADKGYVDWAHEQGYQVWPLFHDSAKSAENEAILSSTENREHIIRQLLAYMAMYNLDGINFDYEKINEATAPYYLQLLRELAPFMKEQGTVLSVDTYVPSAWSMYYNRTEIGKVADYVAVMTYDEHTAAAEYGPVASLGFVSKGIADTLKEVPKEKVLMGIPFYVRVWEEEVTQGETKYSLSNYGMNRAYNRFKEQKAEFVWLPEPGSYYAEYSVEEKDKKTTYRVWLEDERSIEEKMKIYREYDIAGVACWKKGLEKPEAWEVIERHKN